VYRIEKDVAAKIPVPITNISSLLSQSATTPSSIVEAIDIRKTLANQLTEAISMLKNLAIDGRATLTAIDINGVIKDAMADDNKKSPLLDMATPKQHISDSF
jgi:hypothetical protein